MHNDGCQFGERGRDVGAHKDTAAAWWLVAQHFPDKVKITGNVLLLLLLLKIAVMIIIKMLVQMLMFTMLTTAIVNMM